MQRPLAQEVFPPKVSFSCSVNKGASLSNRVVLPAIVASGCDECTQAIRPSYLQGGTELACTVTIECQCTLVLRAPVVDLRYSSVMGGLCNSYIGIRAGSFFTISHIT